MEIHVVLLTFINVSCRKSCDTKFIKIENGVGLKL